MAISEAQEPVFNVGEEFDLDGTIVRITSIDAEKDIIYFSLFKNGSIHLRDDSRYGHAFAESIRPFGY